MSPLVAAPNRGYADWQRVENWDSGVLSSFNIVNRNTSSGTAIIDVSRFAYIGGAIACSQGPVIVQFGWFSDAAATVQVGSRTMVMHPSVVNPVNLRIPNLGPFLAIAFVVIPATNYSISGVLLGTNRYHPLEFIPVNPLLVNVQNVPIGATSTISDFITSYYAGPCMLWALASQPFQVQVMSINSTGTFDFIYQTAIIGAGTRLVANVVIPPTTCVVEMFNTAGVATNYYSVLTPTMTGSS